MLWQWEHSKCRGYDHGSVYQTDSPRCNNYKLWTKYKKAATGRHRKGKKSRPSLEGRGSWQKTGGEASFRVCPASSPEQTTAGTAWGRAAGTPTENLQFSRPLLTRHPVASDRLCPRRLWSPASLGSLPSCPTTMASLDLFSSPLNTSTLGGCWLCPQLWTGALCPHSSPTPATPAETPTFTNTGRLGSLLSLPSSWFQLQTSNSRMRVQF